MDFIKFCEGYSLEQDNIRIKPDSKEKLAEFLAEARKKYKNTGEKVLLIED